MCGILGFTKFNESTRLMANFLAYSMESRGGDSWGGTDGTELIKKVGPISSGFWIPENWTQGIFHTRLKTVGEISERNAHPFIMESAGKQIIGIHNGSVSNWAELNQKYNRQCQVDSEHIFHHIVEGQAMEDLQGRGTIVWYDMERMLHLARWNFGDLEIAELEDNGVVFCSERGPIERAARMCSIKIKTFYQLLEDGLEHVVIDGEVKKREKMGFGSYYRGGHSGNYQGYGYDGRVTNITQGWKRCKKCHIQETQSVICVGCMKRIREEFEREWPMVEVQ